MKFYANNNIKETISWGFHERHHDACWSKHKHGVIPVGYNRKNGKFDTITCAFFADSDIKFYNPQSQKIGKVEFVNCTPTTFDNQYTISTTYNDGQCYVAIKSNDIV